MKRKAIIFLLLAIITTIPFSLNHNDLTRTTDLNKLIKDVETKTEKLLSKSNIPGAAISVLEDGQVTWIGTFGYADLDVKRKVDQNTVFQVASISKSVTALGVMKLVEDGLINLNDPIENYITRWQLPESEYDQKAITVRGLLSHTSGLSVGGGYPGYESNTQLPTLEDSLSGIGGGSKPVELVNEPGARYSYSGGGYNLLQLMIEEVTGEDFHSYLNEVVLAPLGMENSSFQWDDHLQDKTAKAYDVKLQLLPNYIFTEKAAAGLYTTIEDMNKFIIAEINSFHRSGILEADTVQEMFSPILEVRGFESFINDEAALGHFINHANNSKIVTHDGSNNGWKAHFSMEPQTGNGLIILTNGNNGTYLLNELVSAWYYTNFGIERQFDQLRHFVMATVYVLSILILCWSLSVIVNLVSAFIKKKLIVTTYSNKKVLLLKLLVSIVLVSGAFLLSKISVLILWFIDPFIVILLVTSVFIRTILAVLQLFTRESEIRKHVKF
ncbi:serine hydrolase domain-containing protein [Alkalihalobacillus pseudalcaliphilus]|uniref:serine hydrolase domain-containing protein n=1 Tax=Alkalihalobacillus pseudalcaliphilus TaxID=79884 RepID=UPI00069CE543|nr:serine hydrolase domain-containing protein [Alkalihalobacillus pseudalcaliphilus]